MLVNKKAAFTITTLIAIVLGILVLTLLAFGFGTGWQNLWKKISGQLSEANVDAVRQSCQLACSSQSSHAYCCQVRSLRVSKEADAEKVTCKSAESRLGLGSCSSINCGGICGDLCEGTDLEVRTVEDCKNCDKLDRELGSGFEPIEEGEVCCNITSC